MDGEHEPLSDETLAREIEAALAVDPSPEFLARVRARVAQEERPVSWPLRWQWVAGTVVTAIAALLAVYVARAPEPAVSRGPEPIAVVRPLPDAKSSTLTAPAIAERQPAPSSSGSVRTRTPVAASIGAASATAVPEVLISDEERRGFQLLLASLSKEKDAKQLEKALSTVETSGPPWLEVSPIVIEPFPQFAVSEGDAQ